MIKYKPENTLSANIPPLRTDWLIQVLPDDFTNQTAIIF